MKAITQPTDRDARFVSALSEDPTTPTDLRDAADILEAGAIIGEARTHTRDHIRKGLLQIERWMEIKQRKPWKLVKQTWEEWAPSNLYYSARYINDMIDNAHKIGPEAMQAMLDAEVSLRKIIAVRRAATEGKIRIEGTVIYVGRDAIDIAKNREDAEALYNTLYEERRIERESLERAEDRLKQQQEASQKLLGNQYVLIERQKVEIRSLRELPAPEELQSEAECETWRAAREALEVCGLRIASLVGLVHKDGVTDAFRARIVGQLRAMQTWLNTAILETSEILPPEIDIPIELERQACAISATLTDGQLGAVRQYVAAKAALVSGSESNGDGHVTA